MNLQHYFQNHTLEVQTSLTNSIIANKTTLKSIQNIITKTIQTGNKIFIAGNGGSASGASHMAGELVGRFEKERKALNVEALTTDLATITAIANDYSYEQVFSRQLEGKATDKDLFIAFSTSGNSANIVKALEYCEQHKIKSILFSGKNNSKGSFLATKTFHAQSERTSTIQTVHEVLMHSICNFVEEQLL